MKKKEIPLTSRLKKQYTSPQPEPEKPPAEPPAEPAAQGEAVRRESHRPKRETRKSVLTPTYIAQQNPDEPPVTMYHAKYQMAAELHQRLPAILKDASPFSSPLSAAKLIDLVYCETLKSHTLQNRLKSQRDGLTLGQYRKTSTLVIPTYICEYLKDLLDTGTIPSVSLFLAWCVSDWNFIKSHITYRGIK